MPINVQQQHGNSLSIGNNSKTKNALLNCIGNIIKQIHKCSIDQSRDFLTKALLGNVKLIKLYINLVSE